MLPDPVEEGIDNFFNNLAEPGIVINDLLQGKLVQAASDTGRFLVNSTVGVLGLFDVGSRIGLPKHRESLGQTLGVWGIGEGPFVMLPLFGPNNARSATGFAVESLTTSLPPYLTEGADERRRDRRPRRARRSSTPAPGCCPPATCSTAPRSIPTCCCATSG